MSKDHNSRVWCRCLLLSPCEPAIIKIFAGIEGLGSRQCNPTGAGAPVLVYVRLKENENGWYIEPSPRTKSVKKCDSFSLSSATDRFPLWRSSLWCIGSLICLWVNYFNVVSSKARRLMESLLFSFNTYGARIPLFMAVRLPTKINVVWYEKV